MEMVRLAGGGSAPKACVDAIDELETRWPGASFHGARAAIAVAVVKAYKAEMKKEAKRGR